MVEVLVSGSGEVVEEGGQREDHSLRTNTFRFLLKKAQDKVPRRLVANMTTVSTRCKLVS